MSLDEILDDIVNIAIQKAQKKLIWPPHDVNAEMARNKTMKRTKTIHLAVVKKI